MWKQKRWMGQIFVEAEAAAGSGKRVPLLLPLWAFISNVKNLNVVQFFVKYLTKTKCLIDHHLQRNIFKRLWFSWIRRSPTPINSTIKYVAKQLIFKIISVQKCSILVQKFKDFRKNASK